MPRSDGCYVNAKTGRRTKRGDKARQKTVAQSEEEEADEGTVAKIRRCPPRCIVCCATKDPNDGDSKIAKTTIYCSICLVHLCTRKPDNRQTTCFERFHQIHDLSDLKSARSPAETKESSSKKRKQNNNE
jgi:hypothetical protein